ncbi:Na+/H+ antiporter subunit E [Halalkalicoccus salilacus]|uniref:Na+/H+ antiporter subunit E n=1 Tax=Halalkalicoccus salilacus TaxID=3117459 RepID=UPI00300E7196
MTRTWPVVGGAFGVLWVFIRGPALAVDAIVGQLLFGLAVGLPVAYVFRRLYTETISLRQAVRSMPPAMLLSFEVVKRIPMATLDVAYRVITPELQIEPEVIVIPLRVRSDLGVTAIANSIAIPPGSLSLDYDDEEKVLYVHVIDGSDPETIVEVVRHWENYVLTIFNEELSPDDPAPDFSVRPTKMIHPLVELSGVEYDTDIPERHEGENDDG